MDNVADSIAEILLKTEAIQIYRDRPFVFVSGRISPVYIDCRRLLSFPDVRREIVDQMVKKAEAVIGLTSIDVVAGGETAGIPYAAFVAHEMDKPMVYIRKQPKGYGGTKQIEGILEAGNRVLLVEDLITDGMSKLRFNVGIRAQGARTVACLCVFEYGSDRLGIHEGRKNLGEHDIPLHSLTNWDHVLDIGVHKHYMTDDATHKILDFLKDADGWGRRMGFS